VRFRCLQKTALKMNQVPPQRVSRSAWTEEPSNARAIHLVALYPDLEHTLVSHLKLGAPPSFAGHPPRAGSPT
jgi:hypothetical protein